MTIEELINSANLAESEGAQFTADRALALDLTFDYVIHTYTAAYMTEVLNWWQRREITAEEAAELARRWHKMTEGRE